MRGMSASSSTPPGPPIGRNAGFWAKPQRGQYEQRDEHADRIVGWTVFEQLAGKPMQKARVNDKESVVAVAIGEVGMKRFHRFCVVCIETAQ